MNLAVQHLTFIFQVDSIASTTSGELYSTGVFTGTSNFFAARKSAENQATFQNNLLASPITAIGTGDIFILKMNSSAPLPLNLLNFTGKNNDIGNQLNWLTANEVALSHFEIERSENAKIFKKIGEVNAKGGPSEKVEYEFFDSQLTSLNSQLFYRLKMMDLDGKFKYSKIINIENKLKTELTVYPNPTFEYFSLSGNMAFEKLQIVDLSGRILKEFLPQQDNKYHLAEIPLGTYLLKSVDGKGLKINKLIITK